MMSRMTLTFVPSIMAAGSQSSVFVFLEENKENVFSTLRTSHSQTFTASLTHFSLQITVLQWLHVHYLTEHITCMQCALSVNIRPDIVYVYAKYL